MIYTRILNYIFIISLTPLGQIELHKFHVMLLWTCSLSFSLHINALSLSFSLWKYARRMDPLLLSNMHWNLSFWQSTHIESWWQWCWGIIIFDHCPDPYKNLITPHCCFVTITWILVGSMAISYRQTNTCVVFCAFSSLSNLSTTIQSTNFIYFLYISGNLSIFYGVWISIIPIISQGLSLSLSLSLSLPFHLSISLCVCSTLSTLLSLTLLLWVGEFSRPHTQARASWTSNHSNPNFNILASGSCHHHSRHHFFSSKDGPKFSYSVQIAWSITWYRG